MVKMRRALNSILFLCALSSIFSVHAEITIQYAELTSESAEPAIAKVMFTKDLKEQEIPRITFAQLVDEKQRTVLGRKDALLKSWERFTLAQVMTYFFAGAAFIKNYINDDDVVTFKKTPFMQGMLKKVNTIGAVKCKVAAALPLVALAVVPFVWYSKFFGLHDVDLYYPHEEVESKIAVFRKKTYSHSVSYGNTVVHYYNISDPIGYMMLDEREKEFEPMRQANKRMHISLLNAVLCGAGLMWAAFR